MVKHLITILFVFFFTTVSFAQSDQKSWAEGKLNWDDFVELENKIGDSEMSYYLGYRPSIQKQGRITVHRHKAVAYVDKNLSWVKPQKKTDQYLRYHQVIFDILEIFRRRLQYEIDRVHSIAEVEGKFYRIYTNCNYEIERFNQESDRGNVLSVIESWENTSAQELQQPAYDQLPEYEIGNFGYGLEAGIGSGYFSGSLGQHFSPTFNFMYGFDFAFKNSIIYLKATLGVDKLRKDYVAERTWMKGQKAELALLDVSYGYVLLNNSRLKIAPFAGFSVIEISETGRDDTRNNLRFVDYNFIWGLNTDFKIKTKLNFHPNPFMSVREKVETSVRARLYATRVNYAEDLKGFSINLTLGLCGFGQFMRVK